MRNKKYSIAFIINNRVRISRNQREFYLSREIKKHNIRAVWFYTHEDDLNAFFLKRFESYKINTMKKRKFKILKWYIELVIKLRKKEIDAVWISGHSERNIFYLFLIFLMLRIVGIKILYDPIDPIYEDNIVMGRIKTRSQAFAQKNILKIIYYLTAITFVVTEELKETMIANGFPQSRFEIAYWGIDIHRFNKRNIKNTFLKEKCNNEKFVIGWLGNMISGKGIEEILIPLIQIIPNKIENAYFLIGGKGRLERCFLELKEDVKCLEVAGEIPYEKAPGFTNSIDLYIVPIYEQNLFVNSIRPVKVFDAVALGVPVLITETKATKRLLEWFDGVTLVKPDLSSFIEKVQYVYDNYSDIKNRAKRNTAIVNGFTHQKISKDILKKIETKIINTDTK
ncbi:glycosyltransferase [Marispirochaeta sp.]|uniref:glycosyltransferase n=1 Tax=Marispirochaeta sp. TaxID=2038653 RepID=UPI0029C8AEF9|nr:glycosyltransferase [Marispirochaeta sp.]